MRCEEWDVRSLLDSCFDHCMYIQISDVWKPGTVLIYGVYYVVENTYIWAFIGIQSEWPPKHDHMPSTSDFVLKHTMVIPNNTSTSLGN